MRTEKTAARDGFVRGTPQGNALARRTLLICAGVGLLILVALVQLGENGIFAFSHLRVRQNDLRREVAALEAQNAQLDRQLQQLANDPEALETLAREKYNMRRSDEEVLLVVQPQK